MKSILLLEDDKTLGESLYDRLSKDHKVFWAENLYQGDKFLNQHRAELDLAILDVNLPDGSGFDLAKNILSHKNIPVIFLTAQADAESRLKGFELGAQEYIPKPFFLKELLLRVSHVLELHPATDSIELPDLTVSFDEMCVKHKSGKIEYPASTDLKVLKLLYAKSPQVVSRDEIFDEVWGKDKTPNLRTVDNIIVRLRQLLGSDSEVRLRNVRGIGYQWVSDKPV